MAYRVPRVPSTPRIAVWRKLRTLGVAQIGDGLVALPEDARTREQLEWVAADVDAAGGSAILWLGELLSAVDEQQLVAQLRRARAEEYRALMAQAEQGQSVNRLRRELRRIRRRDYFPSPEQELARRAIDAFAVQSGQPTSTGTGGQPT